VVAAVEENDSYVDSLEHVPDPGLVNINWAWERRDQSGKMAFTVPDPSEYLLFFKEDGSFSAKMNCNYGSGQYATHSPGGGQQSIFMELEPMTMVACDQGSYAEDMSQMFGPAQSYRYEEDGAVVAFVFVAGGPVDYYRNLDTLPSEALESSYLDSLEHSPDPELVNTTWVWQRRDPNGNDIPPIYVSNSEAYTLTFNEDGTFSTRMDCNNANGGYATTRTEDLQKGIYMELGPSQIAFCGEDSLDTQMAQMFGPAQNYYFEGNGTVLAFNWVAGGPIDYFLRLDEVKLATPDKGAATGTAIAPDGVFLRSGPGTNYPYVGAVPFGTTGEIIGVSQDGAWWLATAPNQPGSQVWVTADWVEVTGAENVPVVAASPVELTLTAVPWEWVSTTDPAQGTVAVGDPNRYVIVLNEDGNAFIQADCNNVQATYTTDGSNISMVPGASTRAVCPADTRDSQFLAQLSAAAIYFIEGGNLYLDLPANSGTMRFVPQGTPPPREDAPAGDGDGQTFYLVSFGPQGAQQPPIPGTQITANFAGDVVTGNAGCNNYSGTLTPVDDYFTVGPIITTRQFCGEPAGVMEQEQAFLTALEATGGYLWEQSRLADGRLVTKGQLFYSLGNNEIGIMNFSTLR
jgi:heat shock protein HslJ